MKVILETKTNSDKETLITGKKLFKIMPHETNLIFLDGDVGAGKTTFVKGFAEAMGIEETITSPTYGYKKEYPGLIHYDLYLSKKMRKKEIKSLISEDLEDNVVVIEWGNKIPKIDGSLIVQIRQISETSRMIRVKVLGE